MLETEIKKLTAALEANTAALLGGPGVDEIPIPAAKNAKASKPAAPKPIAPPVAAAPAAIPPVAPPVVAAPQPVAPAPVAPAPVAPVPVAPVPVAPVPVAQPTMTHQQAQAELVTLAQALGDGAAIQQTMVQYGSDQLNLIPVENLFSLVQACKALPKI